MPKQHAESGVAQRVTTLLNDQGLSGRRLARDLNWSAPYIARRLSGEVEFSESDIRAVAKRLHVSFDYLLGAEDVAA